MLLPLKSTSLSVSEGELVPSASAEASYSPLVFLLVITVIFGVSFLVVRRFYHGGLRRVDPWDCGFPEQTSRMQDTADAVGQPIRRIFAPIFDIRREIPRANDLRPTFKQSVDDKHWRVIYLRVARLTQFLSGYMGKLQQGRISVYLFYSLATLIVLLVFAQ